MNTCPMPSRMANTLVHQVFVPPAAPAVDLEGAAAIRRQGGRHCVRLAAATAQADRHLAHLMKKGYGGADISARGRAAAAVCIHISWTRSDSYYSPHCCRCWPGPPARRRQTCGAGPQMQSRAHPGEMTCRSHWGLQASKGLGEQGRRGRRGMQASIKCHPSRPAQCS